MPRYGVNYKEIKVLSEYHSEWLKSVCLEIRDVKTIMIADNKKQIERTLKDCNNAFDIQIKEKN